MSKIEHKKNKGGRPKKVLNKKQLQMLMGYRPTLWDVAGFFECGRETVIRFIKKEYGMEFKEFRSTYMAGTKLKIIQKAIIKAQEGNNEMIKFVLQNLAGWTNGFAKREDFDEEDFIEDIEWHNGD